MSQPRPVKPYLPKASGPSSHSPEPRAAPSAIMLGPSTEVMTSLMPITGLLNTSSGAGRSSSGSSGRLTPICIAAGCLLTMVSPSGSVYDGGTSQTFKRNGDRQRDAMARG